MLDAAPPRWPQVLNPESQPERVSLWEGVSQPPNAALRMPAHFIEPSPNSAHNRVWPRLMSAIFLPDVPVKFIVAVCAYSSSLES